MICGCCGKKIEPDDPCYQVRIGHLDDTGDFIPDEDYAYHCSDCGVETGNFSS